ncbi:MAG: leucine efflux protein LeuE [Burkholderiales bacterium]|nr:leucine efflux protein LeuE [Burkholderiales bacterium]
MDLPTSFYGVTDLWTYVLGALGIILLPGPNSLYVLAVASARGVKAGYQGACGVFLGDTILLLLTAAGAASLLRAYPQLFVIIKYIGAAYLGYIGLQLIWGALRNLFSKSEATQAQNTQPPANMQHPFRRALFVSLLNPKALLFLLSFFIQFIDPHYPTPAIPFLILSVIVMTFSAIYLSLLILIGAKLADTFRRQSRLKAGLSSGVGGMFVWFGVKLANAGLH